MYAWATQLAISWPTSSTPRPTTTEDPEEKLERVQEGVLIGMERSIKEFQRKAYLDQVQCGLHPHNSHPAPDLRCVGISGGKAGGQAGRICLEIQARCPALAFFERESRLLLSSDVVATACADTSTQFPTLCWKEVGGRKTCAVLTRLIPSILTTPSTAQSCCHLSSTGNQIPNLY